MTINAEAWSPKACAGGCGGKTPEAMNFATDVAAGAAELTRENVIQQFMTSPSGHRR